MKKQEKYWNYKKNSLRASNIYLMSSVLRKYGPRLMEVPRPKILYQTL